jgi:hypothetical protein
MNEEEVVQEQETMTTTNNEDSQQEMKSSNENLTAALLETTTTTRPSPLPTITRAIAIPSSLRSVAPFLEEAQAHAGYVSTPLPPARRFDLLPAAVRI